MKAEKTPEPVKQETVKAKPAAVSSANVPTAIPNKSSSKTKKNYPNLLVIIGNTPVAQKQNLKKIDEILSKGDDGKEVDVLLTDQESMKKFIQDLQRKSVSIHKEKIESLSAMPQSNESSQPRRKGTVSADSSTENRKSTRELGGSVTSSPKVVKVKEFFFKNFLGIFY